MAQTEESQRVSHPLPAYNFRVLVNGTPMRFSKVSGLQREFKTLTYRHGLSFLEGERISRYRIDEFISLTLEQGTVIGSVDLLEWFERKALEPMEVSLCDETGLPVVTWRIAKALPLKLTTSTFDASTNEVCVDSLEVQAAGISVEHVG